MEKHRDKIAKLDAKLADPSLYDRDPDEAVRLGTARDKAQADLDKAEEAWLAASEAYETAASA
jgi:ATP-binding cassette subfamily F protein 3